MKGNNLILLIVVAAVAYYLFKESGQAASTSLFPGQIGSSVFPGQVGTMASTATGSTSSGAPISTVGSQSNILGGNPYQTVHLSVTSNPVVAIPGTSTAYNNVLPPNQQVDPNNPPPILCSPGLWPTRGANGSWGCDTPHLMI